MTKDIVRDAGIISAEQYALYGPHAEDRVAELENKILARAKETADRIGIKRHHVMTSWNLHVVCAFTDYPMYLCGPSAPYIRTASDVFKHVWHLDNPLARFQVVIRDQDWMDAYDIKWYEERADQLQREGREAFSKQWASNVLERAQAVLDARQTQQP